MAGFWRCRIREVSLQPLAIILIMRSTFVPDSVCNEVHAPHTDMDPSNYSTLYIYIYSYSVRIMVSIQTFSE